MVIFVPPMMVNPFDVIGALEEVRHALPKPVVGVLMAPEDARVQLRDSFPEHLALCQFPESAVRAMAALERHRRWVERPVQRVSPQRVDHAAAEKILKIVRGEGRRDLHLREALEVLAAYGIPVARYAAVRSADAAEAAASPRCRCGCAWSAARSPAPASAGSRAARTRRRSAARPATPRRSPGPRPARRARTPRCSARRASGRPPPAPERRARASWELYGTIARGRAGDLAAIAGVC